MGPRPHPASLVTLPAALTRRTRSLIVKEIAISRDQTEEQVKAEIEAIFMAN